MVKRKGFLLFELMVFFSVISFFVMSFYLFEVKTLNTSHKIKDKQTRLAILKNDYYLAMTATVAELKLLSKYAIEDMNETHYKIRVVSDDVFSDLSVIRKK